MPNPLIVVILWLLASLQVHADSLFPGHEINQKTERLSLDAGMLILRDPGSQLSRDQLLQQPPEAFTLAQGRRDLHFGYTSDQLWLVTRLTASEANSGEWLLELEYPYLDSVILHLGQGDDWQVMHSGGTLPVSQRVIKHRQPLFPVYLPANESVTLVIQIEAKGSMTLNSNLWRPQAFHEQSDRAYVLIAIYFGMLLALGLYNFLLFVAIRQTAFLLYTCFVFSFAAGVLTINGIGPLYLWPELGAPGNRILPLGFIAAATFAFLFARSFLDTRLHAPWWDKVLQVCCLIGGLAIVCGLVLPVQTALWIMSLLGVLTTVLLLSCGISCAFKGVPGARIFVLAWSMLLLGTSLLALRNIGVLPSNLVTVYSIQIGSALEMLLLSLGLAARFNELKRQKEAAQQAMLDTLRAQEQLLETQVAERTRALAEANQQLGQQAVHDPLTELFNRAGAIQQLDLAITRAARYGHTLAVMMIDLDGFKPINDQHGHAAGDQVLRVIATRLQTVARDTDIVARFGGDEFVLVAEQIGAASHAEQLAQRLLEGIMQQIDLDSGAQVQVAASIGIALADGSHSSDTMLKVADDAMYERKHAGKQGVNLHTV